MNKNKIVFLWWAIISGSGFIVAMDRLVLPVKEHADQISILESVQNFLKQEIINKYISVRTTSLDTNPKNGVQAVVSADGRKILISTKKEHPTVVLYEDQGKGGNPKFEPICVLKMDCSCIAMSPDGSKIVIVTDMDVFVIDFSEAPNLQKNMKFSELNNTIKFVKFSEDSSSFATLDEASNIVVWNTRDMFITKEAKRSLLKKPLFLQNVGSCFSDLLINTDGTVIAARYNDGLFLYRCNELATGVPIKFSYLKGFVMSPDGKSIVMWNEHDKMFLVNAEDFSDVKLIPMVSHKKGVSSVAFSHDNKLIGSVGPDGFIMWHESGKALYRLSTEKQLFNDIAFSHDSKKLLLYGSNLLCYDIEKIFNDRALQKPDFIMGIESDKVKSSKLFFSNDDKRIIFSGSATVVVAPLTDADLAVLEKIKQCTPVQQQLLYKAFEHNGVIPMDLNDFNPNVFNTLPNDIQDALSDWIPQYFGVLQTIGQISKDSIIIPQAVKEEKPVDIKGKTEELPKKKSKKRDKTKRKIAREQKAHGAQNQSEQQSEKQQGPGIQIPEEDDSVQEAPAESFDAVSSNNPKTKNFFSVLKEEVQSVKKAIVSVLNPEQQQETFLRTGLTYAAVVHPFATSIKNPIQREPICFKDTYLEIYIPDAWKKRDKNPILSARKSRHVEETSARPTDYYHNFSRLVHKKLGQYADAEQFIDSQYKFSTGTLYTIPGKIILPSDQEKGIRGKEVFGTFRFVVVKDKKKNDCKLIHNFFKPDKSVDKKKKI